MVPTWSFMRRHKAPFSVAQRWPAVGQAQVLHEHFHFAVVPIAIGRDRETGLGARQQGHAGVVGLAKRLGAVSISLRKISCSAGLAWMASPNSIKLAWKVSAGTTWAPHLSSASIAASSMKVAG